MTTIILTLPWPPSANTIWRGTGRGIHRSKKYMAWIKQAGLAWLTQRSSQPKSIKGKFCLRIDLWPPDKRLIDMDNRVKPLLDCLQHLAIIENDHYCQHLLVAWGDPSLATKGGSARLTISSW